MPQDDEFDVFKNAWLTGLTRTRGLERRHAPPLCKRPSIS